MAEAATSARLTCLVHASPGPAPAKSHAPAQQQRPKQADSAAKPPAKQSAKQSAKQTGKQSAQQSAKQQPEAAEQQAQQKAKSKLKIKAKQPGGKEPALLGKKPPDRPAEGVNHARDSHVIIEYINSHILRLPMIAAVPRG